MGIRFFRHAALLVAVWVGSVVAVRATHGIAGDVTYRYLGGNRFEITVTTYSNPCDAGVDDCVAELRFYEDQGNGNFVFLPALTIQAQRINGPLGVCDGVPNRRLGEIIRVVNPSFCIQLNIYRVVVDLPGPGAYQIRYAEFSRLANVANMTASDNVWWYFSTNVTFGTFTQNNSVVMLNQPIDQACIGQPWSHNPAPVDPDGDSLVFSLIPPQQWDPNFTGTDPTTVPGHRFPDDPAFGVSDFDIDPATGLVTWNTPQQAGVYAIAIRVEEYRNGVKVGEVIRDMAIIVADICTNRPPQIETISDTCVKPGQDLRFFVLARDPDAQDSVYFYLTEAFDTTGVLVAGGIFDPARPSGGVARLTPPNDPRLRPQLTGLMSGPPDPPLGEFPVVTEFSWTPECPDISRSSYTIDFYAHDRLTPLNGVTLATNEIVTIDVLGPPVFGVTAVGIGNASVQVDWNPAACPNVANYRIYRATDSLAVPLDTCCTDNPGAGYSLVGTVPAGTTTFIDGPGIPFSGAYCYRVVVEYTVLGGTVLGCPSEQACVRQEVDQPVILNVDVATTDAANGVINLRWRQPVTLNAPLFTPPFRYSVQQTTGIGGTAFSEINTLPTLNDTTLTVTGLNTVANPYRYRIDILDANNQLVSTSAPASSVRMAPQGLDSAVSVNFSVNVPWTNFTYRLFRSETGINGTYVPLTTQTITTPGQQQFTYVDLNVVQGTEYCYYVETVGSYNNPAVHTDSLFNRSNRACARPQDFDPPCALPATITCSNDSATVNLILSQPPDSCGSDIEFYYVFLEANGQRTIIDTITVSAIGSYPFTITYGISTIPNLAGCLSFQPVDQSGNIGEIAGRACISDVCAFFQLPNVITPNGDGINDVFTPLNYRDGTSGQLFLPRGVTILACVIYDRTGRAVARSTNINNLWDGNINGAPAPEGQYFYYIDYVLDSIENPVRTERTGSFSLLR